MPTGDDEVKGYHCFGIPVASCLSFPGAWPAMPPRADATVVATGDLPPWDGTDEVAWQGLVDQERFVVRRSRHGGHRFFHGGRTLFDLSADNRVLLGATDVDRDTLWWRALLDSVLFTVGLLRGNDALHAGAVATHAGAVAVVGRSGAGKSTLLGHLKARGADLVTDDVLFVSAGPDCVLAHPGPPLMSLPHGLKDIGASVSRVRDEVWAAVPVVPEPIPLRRIVLLDRRRNVGAPTLTAEPPLTVLMRHLLEFPRTAERAASRLSTASAIAEHVEILRLRADVATPPGQLADLALSGLDTDAG
jgi:hypothetical protein